MKAARCVFMGTSGEEGRSRKEKPMKETLLEVDGMSCPSCVRHINSALCDLDGIAEVDVKLRERTVRVTHDASSAPTSALVEALRGAGYASRPKAA